MQYIHNGQSVSMIDQKKPEYDTWWIGGTTRDQIDGINGNTFMCKWFTGLFDGAKQMFTKKYSPK